MKIRQLRVTIEPALGDAVCLKWEVYLPDTIIGYKRVFSGTEVEQSNDFKSHWDHVWDTAKREIEKTQDVKPEGQGG